MPRIPRTAATTVMLLASASLAFADTLPFDGAYGNAAGCLYAQTGVETASEEMFLLTPEGVTTSVSYCGFEQVLNSTPQRFAVRAACHGADTVAKAALDMNVIADGVNAYSLRLDDGTTWGPLDRCQ
ncbi:hypothetical protein ACQQ2Q_19990 [Agrobacterium sp. ES01]|uniref:hypothetical protein n=1 Tax=Agrobacterium sp. ES01 TaxID=3420714 RepID=UPI003D09BA26